MNEKIIRDYKLVFLFSGQGSQYRGMAEKLYKTNAVFANNLEMSDQYLKEVLGKSLLEELYHNKDATFNDLLITHPAIVAIELALFSVLKAKGIQPDYVVGNSLGEFSAAVVSGIWSEKQAVESAFKQAQIIVQNNKKGGMLAIFNITPYLIEQLMAQYDLYVASNNFPGHYTLTGAIDNLDALEMELKKSLEISFKRLPVDYPFHCELIKGKIEYLRHMSEMEPLNQPTKGFISGLYAKELSELSLDYFWNVVSQQSNFINTVTTLEKKKPCLYVDLGPSGTSTTFVKYNLGEDSDSMVHPIMTPFRQEDKQLQKLFQILNP